MDFKGIVADVQLAAAKAQAKHEYRMAEIKVRERYAEIDERRVAVEEKRLKLDAAIAGIGNLD